MIAGDVPEALLAAIRRAGLDSVNGAFAYEGGADLSKPGLGHRRRTRIELSDGQGAAHVLYLKRYGPQTLGEALRRWWTHGRRRSPARIEFENIRSARLAGGVSLVRENSRRVLRLSPVRQKMSLTICKSRSSVSDSFSTKSPRRG